MDLKVWIRSTNGDRTKTYSFLHSYISFGRKYLMIYIPYYLTFPESHRKPLGDEQTTLTTVHSFSVEV